MSDHVIAPSALTRIRASLSLLGPGELRVAQTVLADPDAVIAMSSTELAEAAGTSAATVSRACQSLGYRGYQHLRLELARSSGQPAQPADDPVSRIFSEAIDAIRVGRQSVDPAALAAAAAAITGARRLVLTATGFSGPAAQDAAMRFATLGRAVEAPVDVLAQQFAAHALGPADVCLAVSYSGANAHSLGAGRAAKDGGATVIAVTSFVKSPLTRIADIVLLTGPIDRAHDVDPLLSRISHQLVLLALHAAVAERLGTQAPGNMREVVAEALTDEA